MTLIAKQDLIVHDEAFGIDRRVFAGQAVPADLIDAYEKAGGQTEEPRPKSVGVSPIATETVTVRDDRIGISRRIIEGQPVPADLIDAYNDQVGGDVAASVRAEPKAAVEPEPAVDVEPEPTPDVEPEPDEAPKPKRSSRAK